MNKGKEKELKDAQEFYEIDIEETGVNSPKAIPNNGYGYCFNKISKRFSTLEEAREYLKERYGKLPKGEERFFINKNAGSRFFINKDAESRFFNNNDAESGFQYSFWNQDISHGSKKWFQTDFISVSKVRMENSRSLIDELLNEKHEPKKEPNDEPSM